MIRLLRPLTALAFAAVALAPQIARADDTIKHPGDHPSYGFELEPHLLFGWDNIYPEAASAWEVASRSRSSKTASSRAINNSVAISFGWISCITAPPIASSSKARRTAAVTPTSSTSPSPCSGTSSWRRSGASSGSRASSSITLLRLELPAQRRERVQLLPE